MPPSRAGLALMSLLVVSPKILVEPTRPVGNLEGGFKPEGRMFSSWESGRSMLNAGLIVVARSGRPDLSRESRKSSQAIEGDTSLAIDGPRAAQYAKHEDVHDP